MIQTVCRVMRIKSPFDPNRHFFRRENTKLEDFMEIYRLFKGYGKDMKLKIPIPRKGTFRLHR